MPAADTSSLLNALQRATIGEYEIRAELGRGGMAVVYLAHEIRFGRKVAIKVLAPHLQVLPGMPARFLREAQTAANLEHPNIIPIYSYRESSDFAFFTMRFVAGAPLSAIARQLGQLPVPVVRSLLADIGSALSFAHAHGVMHRDVKPGNVLVGSDGGVVVTDFGIAKQAEVPGLTLTGQLLGTPRYMSPEQCRGHEITPASDQYSLATLAYELLAARPPFVGANAMDVMAQQMVDPVPDLRTLRPDCPADLAETLTRMLAKQPRDRFPSIDDALHAAQAMPILPTDPVRVQLRRWVESPAHSRGFAITPISPSPRSADSILAARAAAATPVSAPTPTSTPTPASAPAADPPPADAPGSPVVEHAQIGASTPTLGIAAHERTDRERQTPVATSLLLRSVRSRFGQRWLLPSLGGAALVITVLMIGRWSTMWNSTDKDVTPPVVPRATLIVTALPPDGTIELDGQPAAGPRLEMEAGAHAVRLLAPGYQPLDTILNLVAGSSQALVFSGVRIDSPAPPPPPPVNGTLVLRQLPNGAAVRIDGTRMSGTRFQLMGGRHTVRIDAPGYEAFERIMEVAAGKTQSLAFAGRAVNDRPPPPAAVVQTGVLRLRVRPFARIFVDGRLVTEDEVLTQSLPAGRHTLRFERDGYVTKEATVDIVGGDTTTVAFTLDPRAR